MASLLEDIQSAVVVAKDIFWLGGTSDREVNVRDGSFKAPANRAMVRELTPSHVSELNLWTHQGIHDSNSSRKISNVA